jgi:hypothetical protein
MDDALAGDLEARKKTSTLAKSALSAIFFLLSMNLDPDNASRVSASAELLGADSHR